MRKAERPRCGFCGRELGTAYKRLILRDVEERGSSRRLCTAAEADMCQACGERFQDFQERCRLASEE